MVQKIDEMLRFILLFTICFLSIVEIFGQQSVDYISILKRSGTYDDKRPKIPVFSYQRSSDSTLVVLRKYLKLDSVAGFGSEASRVLNILHWVHNNIRHNGTEESGIKALNAKEIFDAAKYRNIGVSCGELATVLNDCFLAMGVKSRKVYCFPKDSLKNDPDSHVINLVYLLGEKKWIWVDPTWDAYVMDENGNLLGIQEVRERLINGKPLILNPDANWNRRISARKEEYLYHYMAKNLYRLYSPVKSEFNYETRSKNKKNEFIHLVPPDYPEQEMKKINGLSKKSDIVFIHYATSNPSQFWEIPDEK